jgi:hypothetical protein
MVWVSTGLVHWSPQRSAPVSPQWAPEGYWDPALGRLEPSWDFVADSIGKATAESAGFSRGEGLAIFKANTGHKGYLFIGEFGGRGYMPFEITAGHRRLTGS